MSDPLSVVAVCLQLASQGVGGVVPPEPEPHPPGFGPVEPIPVPSELDHPMIIPLGPGTGGRIRVFAGDPHAVIRELCTGELLWGDGSREPYRPGQPRRGPESLRQHWALSHQDQETVWGPRANGPEFEFVSEPSSEPVTERVVGPQPRVEDGFVVGSSGLEFREGIGFVSTIPSDNDSLFFGAASEPRAQPK